MEAEKEAMWTERVGFYLDHKNLCLYDIYIFFWFCRRYDVWFLLHFMYLSAS